MTGASTKKMIGNRRVRNLGSRVEMTEITKK